ncbi:MAG TPA: hypothetical protein VGI33_20150 [Paenibacillus sp.]
MRGWGAYISIKKVSRLDSPVLLHATVNGYNWDDGPEPMIAPWENMN